MRQNQIINGALNQKIPGSSVLDQLKCEHDKLLVLFANWKPRVSSERDITAFDAALQALRNVERRLQRVISMLEQGKSLEEAVWVFEIETVQRFTDDRNSYSWTHYKYIKDYLDNERELKNLLVYRGFGKELLTVEEYLTTIRNSYVELSTPTGKKYRDYLASTPGFSELFPDLIMPSNEASSSLLNDDIIDDKLSDCFDSSKNTNDNVESLRVAINAFSEYVSKKSNQVGMDVANKLNEKLSQLNSHGSSLTSPDKVTMNEMKKIIIDSYKTLGPTADGIGYCHTLFQNISLRFSYLSSLISGAQSDDIDQKSVEVGQINPTFFARSTRQKKAVEINEELNKCIEDHPKPGVS